MPIARVLLVALAAGLAGFPALAAANRDAPSPARPAPRPAAGRGADAAPNPWAVADYHRLQRGVATNRFLSDVARAEEERLWARWGPVHDCEQPGNWYAAGRTSDGYFEGGLGIAASLYRSITGHSALQDSPVDQMRTAEVVLSRYGPSAWACDVPF